MLSVANPLEVSWQVTFTYFFNHLSSSCVSYAVSIPVKSFYLDIYFSPQYISFSVLSTPDSGTTANTSEVLPLCEPANFAFVVVDKT